MPFLTGTKNANNSDATSAETAESIEIGERLR